MKNAALLIAVAFCSTDGWCQTPTTLPPFEAIRSAYPEGRMTLGFRLLNNLKKHLERVDLLADRFRLTRNEKTALEVARVFFGSLDLTDLRSSVVVAQIDLERSEIFVKNAKDALASMDRPGGLSPETVRLTARIVDTIIKRSGAFDREISNRASLKGKFGAIRSGALDPFVLSSSLEVATSSFLEAVAQSPSQFDELLRSDSSTYVIISRWRASAQAASAALQKQDLHGFKTLPAVLSSAEFSYEPTPWVQGRIRQKIVEDTSGLSVIVNTLNRSPALPGLASSSVGRLDLPGVSNEPQLASYEEALELRGKYFNEYRLDDIRAQTKYVNLAGFPLIVSASSAPKVGATWQSIKMPVSTSPTKYFSVADFAASQVVSGAVALDTLFVLLTKE